MRRCSIALTLVVLVSGCDKSGKKITDGGVDDARPIDATDQPVDAAIDAPIDAPPPVGHPGTGTVTGAVEAHSPNYRLYGTLSSGGDGTSASPSYQRRGGVTGATQP